MKKPFKETKVGNFLSTALPGIADVLPDKGILGIAKNIIDQSTVSESEKAEMLAEIKNIEFEMFQEQTKDTQNARQREVALKDTIGVWVQNLSACVVIVAFIGLLFGVVFMKIEVQNKELVYTLVGLLGGVVGSIFNYWFGSSQGSTKRNDQMIELLHKK
jgi:hypothetical protein